MSKSNGHYKISESDGTLAIAVAGRFDRQHKSAGMLSLPLLASSFIMKLPLVSDDRDKDRDLLSGVLAPNSRT